MVIQSTKRTTWLELTIVKVKLFITNPLMQETVAESPKTDFTVDVIMIPFSMLGKNKHLRGEQTIGCLLNNPFSLQLR